MAERGILKCRDNFLLLVLCTTRKQDDVVWMRKLDVQDRLSTSSALFPEYAAIPGSQSKDFALRLICDADLLDNSLRRIVRSDDHVQFLSAGHTATLASRINATHPMP